MGPDLALDNGGWLDLVTHPGWCGFLTMGGWQRWRLKTTATPTPTELVPISYSSTGMFSGFEMFSTGISQNGVPSPTLPRFAGSREPPFHENSRVSKSEYPRIVLDMDVSTTGFGSWNGGRFMHFGEPLDEDRWIGMVRLAWEKGIRTFITADVYGLGAADSLLGRALKGVARDSYCLVGAIGHDFYATRRDGAKGYPRFTDPSLRSPHEFRSYLQMAAEKSLERLQQSHFDLLLLHNPDRLGYGNETVWEGMRDLAQQGVTHRLGVAPGPANGFTLDLIQCFERFEEVIDWAMIILSPFEPWPGSLALSAAVQHEVRIMTRVVDHGGIFHGDVRPGHRFGPSDHRSFRPPGWVEAAWDKLVHLGPIAERYGLTPLQLACGWTLAQKGVECVVPTLIQEVSDSSKRIEEKLIDLSLVKKVTFSESDLEAIRLIGDNTGCMALKGANRNHTTEPEPDRWALTPDLEDAGRRWGIEPDRDLSLLHR